MTWLLGFVAFVLLAATLLYCRIVVENEPDFTRSVAEILKGSDNKVESMMAETARNLSRKEIRKGMRVIYRESVLLAVGLGGFAAHVCLVLFNLLFALLWLKSWIWASPKDLRLLLGGEMFIMCQLDSDLE